MIDFSPWRKVNLTKQAEDILRTLRVLKTYYMNVKLFKVFSLDPIK